MPALYTLAQTPTAAHIDGILRIIERFVILKYDTEIPDDSVNKARQTLFTQKGREIDKIPQTKDGLRQHFEQHIRLVMCGARLSLKHCSYQALKNSVENGKMRLPGGK